MLTPVGQKTWPGMVVIVIFVGEKEGAEEEGEGQEGQPWREWWS